MSHRQPRARASAADRGGAEGGAGDTTVAPSAVPGGDNAADGSAMCTTSHTWPSGSWKLREYMPSPSTGSFDGLPPLDRALSTMVSTAAALSAEIATITSV
ncbi:hypothetical protein GCM10023223_44640 [Stackebrandtia albiflava]